MSGQLLDVYDANGDGQLSVEEVAAYWVEHDLDAKLAAAGQVGSLSAGVPDAPKLHAALPAAPPLPPSPAVGGTDTRSVAHVDELGLEAIDVVAPLPAPAPAAVSADSSPMKDLSDRVQGFFTAGRQAPAAAAKPEDDPMWA